jgi:hypothetical protein
MPMQMLMRMLTPMQTLTPTLMQMRTATLTLTLMVTFSKEIQAVKLSTWVTIKPLMRSSRDKTTVLQQHHISTLRILEEASIRETPSFLPTVLM